MIVSKYVFAAASLAGLGANVFASALRYDDDGLWLGARGLDLDEGYGYGAFARRSAEPEYLNDFDLGLHARDADAREYDLKTALLRREVLAAVDSVLARRGKKSERTHSAMKARKSESVRCYDPRVWLGTPHVMSTNHVTPGRAAHSVSSERDVSLMETSCKFFVHTAINLIVPTPQVASISLDTYLLFNNSLNPRDCHPVTSEPIPKSPFTLDNLVPTPYLWFPFPPPPQLLRSSSDQCPVPPSPVDYTL